MRGDAAAVFGQSEVPGRLGVGGGVYLYSGRSAGALPLQSPPRPQSGPPADVNRTDALGVTYAHTLAHTRALCWNHVWWNATDNCVKIITI